jgi:[ribosomal protein S5]-alanine N-acetyltransferase
MRRRWQVTLRFGRVGLRPLDKRDQSDWLVLQRENRFWLGPWEATPPDGYSRPASFSAMLRMLHHQARQGIGIPFGLTFDDRLVGQVVVSGITLGSARWAQVGYWIDKGHAGRNITTVAVALVCDHLMQSLRLHRVELAIRPENVASIRVAEKLGFVEEGMRRRYLHIAGAWRDHLAYSVTAEDVPDGLMARLLADENAGRIVLPR